MPPPVIDVAYLRARLDTVYSSASHSHGIGDITGLTAALAAKFDSAGGPVSGPIVIPDGSVSANSIQFSGQAGTGIHRDANGMQLAHNGTAVLRVRFDQLACGANHFPLTDANRSSGQSNLRWSSVFAAQMRPNPGNAAGPGYAFNDSGTTRQSGMYCVGATVLGLTLNGVSQAEFTSAGMVLAVRLVCQSFTVGTLPSAAANSGGVVRISTTQRLAYSDGTNWRYVADDTVVV